MSFFGANHSEDKNNKNVIVSESNQMIAEEDKNNQPFDEEEIKIIRQYVANLSIQEIQRDQNLKQIAEKIQKQTYLKHKSSQEILAMIHKILKSQNAISSSQQAYPYSFDNQNHSDSSNNNSSQQIQGQQKKQTKGFISKNQQHQSVFQSKSFFKSFYEIAESNQFKHSKQFVYSEKNTPGVRKLNLFTKPSLEISKTPTNVVNSFGTITDYKLHEKQAMEVEYENADLDAFSKKGAKQFRQSTQFSEFRSKRKIKPTNPLLIDPSYNTQEKIEWVDTNTHDCQVILQKKLMKKSLNSNKDSFYVNQTLSAIYNEYFYSNYDKAYFRQQNQVPKLINFLGFDSKRMSLKDFKLIKSALPKPKLFNIQFITSQQNKLNQFRNQLRQLPKDRIKNQEVELLVGKEVTALHPLCGHLHNGNILAIYKENQYIVKFTRPQLGTQKVLDINISSRTLSSNNKATIENLDHESMFMAIKLLEYKRALIEKFKKYNNTIEELKKENKKLSQQLLQQYGWLGSTINILSMGLRHIMVKFRIRGLNQSNQELVGKNFSSLLINPLNLMSKQLQNSLEPYDLQTSNQIKKIVADRSDNRIQEYLVKLESKNKHFITESPINPEEKQNIAKLVRNFMGILVNLRYEGRSFNIQSNRYLDNMQKLVDNQFTEEFNEIYANVHSIVKKIGQTE